MRPVMGLMLIMLTGLCVLGTAAKADTVIADNLDSGGSYNAGFSWGINGTSNPFSLPAISEATDFTSSGNFTLSQLFIPLAFAGPFVSPTITGDVDISIADDDGGLPGTSLESWSVDVPQGNGLFDLSDTTGLVLTAGTTYWIVASPASDTTFAGWNFNDTDASGAMAVNVGGVWLPVDLAASNCGPDPCALPAFEVTGNAVAAPEPSSLLLMGIGLLGITFLRRKYEDG